MAPRENHVLDLWILECEHAIECGCRHSIGMNAWCIYCDAPRKVVGHKIVDYHQARPRNSIGHKYAIGVRSIV